MRERKARAKRYGFLDNVKGYTAQQIALRYVLDNKHISSALFNTTNIDHLKSKLMATEMKMPDEVKRKMQVLSL